MIYIFWTCADETEAKRMVRALLEKRWIACASIFPVESMFRWEGKIEEARETKVVLKTKREHYEAIREFILQEGSYEVPEITAVEGVGNPAYVEWLERECQ